MGGKENCASTGPYDAIIVGSGAGGGTAAWCLTGYCNLRVLVLEKGPHRKSDDFLPYDELHFLDHNALTPSIKTDPNIYVDPAGKVKPVQRWWIGNMVGGATMLWEANLPRYTQEDFSPLRFKTDLWQGADPVDWPWTYDEFQPYFEMAEHGEGASGGVAGTAPRRIRVPDATAPPARLYPVSDACLRAVRHGALCEPAWDQLPHLRQPARVSILWVLPKLRMRRKRPV
jgi:choline dehydrogenase-like flavoprotein